MVKQELFPEIPADVQDRVDAVLLGTDATLTAHEVMIYLRRAAGPGRAVTIAEIQARQKVRRGYVSSPRIIKRAVKELLEIHGVPIGSARGRNPGYFLLCTPEDVDKAEKPLLGEVRSLARRLRAINRKSEISRVLCGQLGLED